MDDGYAYLRTVKPRVYLSGPMDDVSEDEGRNWRGMATALLDEHDIKVVDPYDFEKEVCIPELLVKTDLGWILRCQGMIINASQGVETWGTPMEVLWAHIHRVITVAFVQDTRPSPWLMYHSGVVKTLDQAVERVAWHIRQL